MSTHIVYYLLVRQEIGEEVLNCPNATTSLPDVQDLYL